MYRLYKFFFCEIYLEKINVKKINVTFKLELIWYLMKQRRVHVSLPPFLATEEGCEGLGLAGAGIGARWAGKGVTTLTCGPGEPAELGYSPSLSTTARRAFTLPGRRFFGCFPGALNFGVLLAACGGSGRHV